MINWTIGLPEIAVVLLFPLFALFLDGFRRKAIARMHSRKGPPLMQPVYDIAKLWGKEENKKNFLFNIVPWIALVVSLAMLAFVPFALLYFPLDWLVLGYLFILLDTVFLVGVFASKSPFGFHAAIRELLLMVGYEIGFLICLATFSAAKYSLTLAGINLIGLTAMPFTSIGLLIFGLVILKVTPFDLVNAEPEIGAGFFTEYSGKGLALIEFAEFLKNGVFYVLAAGLLFGSELAFPGAIFLVFFYALMQASSPRLKIFRSARFLLICALLLMLNLAFWRL